jgi:hypothetical protein
MPSEPANIPTIKKKISVGTPSLLVVFPATMLINNKIDPTSNKFSDTINMVKWFAYRDNLLKINELNDLIFLFALNYKTNNT